MAAVIACRLLHNAPLFLLASNKAPPRSAKHTAVLGAMRGSIEGAMRAVLKNRPSMPRVTLKRYSQRVSSPMAAIGAAVARAHPILNLDSSSKEVPPSTKQIPVL